MFEQRDPFLMRQQLAEPELTEWDRYARQEYARLAMEDDLNQELDLDEEDDEAAYYTQELHLDEELEESMDIDEQERATTTTTRATIAEAPF